MNLAGMGAVFHNGNSLDVWLFMVRAAEGLFVGLLLDKKSW